MTTGREQSDCSQGDLVFRGRIRIPTAGRIDHLRHLQDRAELQRRLDAVEELRKALTRLFALPGATEGTEGYRHPRNNPPAKSVKVLLANCTEEIWDRDAVTYGGKLNRQKGKVIVKWQGRRPKGVAEHQEWPMFAVTEVGFALVLDPWGNPHCLPPRDAIGDVRYGLQDPDCYYFVAMQTIC